MDFFTIVIIMAIIYLLPELLKKRKSKEYKYPKIPVPPSLDETASEHMTAESPAAHIPISHSGQSAVSPASQVSYAAAGDSVRKNSWQGNLDQSMVMNGIIFAEIISPPLAKRSRQKVYNNFKDLK